MNDELKTILMNLPDGIILIDEETKRISLSNEEFKRIFTISDNDLNEGEIIK